MAHILVIADEPWIINDVRAALESGGRRVQVESDPHQATAAAAESPPTAVVVDMQVGSMGGMAVTRALRNAPELDEVPAIVILLDRDADAFLAGRSGADGWVRKPFSAHELRSAIDEHAPVSNDAS